MTIRLSLFRFQLNACAFFFFFFFSLFLSFMLLCFHDHTRVHHFWPLSRAAPISILVKHFTNAVGLEVGIWDLDLQAPMLNIPLLSQLNHGPPFFFYMHIFIYYNYIFNEWATWSRLWALHRDNHSSVQFQGQLPGNLFIFSHHSWLTTPAHVVLLLLLII